MRFIRLNICLLIILVLTAFDVSAITFDQIFFAGDGRDGKLGEARSQFTPDESRIYLRFIYRDGQPGQKLIAYWQIVKDNRGRSGEFATSQMILEKVADRGQFSFNAEEPWALGQYRVTITDSNNIIVEEMDFQVVSDKSQSVAKSGQNSQLDVQDEELPPSFLDQYRPDQGALIISKVFSAGRQESDQFKNSEPAVYIRFEYEGAIPNQTVDAVWDHLGENGQGGIGIFARAQVKLDKSLGRAQFSFRPKPAGSWLAGDYLVVLLSDQKIVGQTQFTIGSTTRKAGRYDEIVTAVSDRGSLDPDAVNRLYKQKPSLFKGLRKTLDTIQSLGSFVSRGIDSLTRSINWEEELDQADVLSAFKASLRSYLVSQTLLPKEVNPPTLPSDLTRQYMTARNSRTPIQSFGDIIAESSDFPGRQELYTRLLKAKGQTESTIPQDLADYLKGKADLYWRNRLELHYQHVLLKQNQSSIKEALWQQRRQDLDEIRAAINQ